MTEQNSDVSQDESAYCLVCQNPIGSGTNSLRIIHRTGGLDFGEETACGCLVHDDCRQAVTSCAHTQDPASQGIRLIFRP